MLDKKLDRATFTDIATSNIRIKDHCLKEFGSKAEARFLERKNQLDLVTYSLLRVSNLRKLRELFLRIQEKEVEFGELASIHSEGMEKQTRGIIGPIPLDKAHPVLAEQLRTSKIGEVSQPFKVDKYYLVIRVESYKPVQLDNLMREKMSEELFEEWLNSKSQIIFDELITKLKLKNESLGDKS